MTIPHFAGYYLAVHHVTVLAMALSAWPGVLLDIPDETERNERQGYVKERLQLAFLWTSLFNSFVFSHNRTQQMNSPNFNTNSVPA